MEGSRLINPVPIPVRVISNMPGLPDEIRLADTNARIEELNRYFWDSRFEFRRAFYRVAVGSLLIGLSSAPSAENTHIAAMAPIMLWIAVSLRFPGAPLALPFYAMFFYLAAPIATSVALMSSGTNRLECIKRLLQVLARPRAFFMYPLSLGIRSVAASSAPFKFGIVSQLMMLLIGMTTIMENVPSLVRIGSVEVEMVELMLKQNDLLAHIQRDQANT